MKSRLTTILLVLGLLAFGAAGSFAAVGQLSSAGHHHHHAKKAKKGKRHHHAAHAKHHVKHAAQAPAGAAPTGSDEGGGRSAAGHEYGTRPGKGCGDKNHIHTGPPGNPGNTACPHR